jgi:hypothetical protein
MTQNWVSPSCLLPLFGATSFWTYPKQAGQKKVVLTSLEKRQTIPLDPSFRNVLTDRNPEVEEINRRWES